jgi:hypothetical protein
MGRGYCSLKLKLKVEPKLLADCVKARSQTSLQEKKQATQHHFLEKSISLFALVLSH